MAGCCCSQVSAPKHLKATPQWQVWYARSGVILSAIALALSLAGIHPFHFDLAWFAVLFCGVPIVRGAAQELFLHGNIKAGLLVSVALLAALGIGEIFAAGEVAFIMTLGERLEGYTLKRAQAGLRHLAKLLPNEARKLTCCGKELMIPIGDIKVGDTLRILPGERIPLDGTILRGESAIDPSILTGESMPVEKHVGDTVMSGTLNTFGAFEIRVERTEKDSAVQRMAALTAAADARRARIVQIADRWASVITVVALLTAIGTWLGTGLLIRGVTVLVVFCPCSLVLATPTAIVAAIGNASKHGFLVRVGDAFERLAKVTCIAFDKTGTLTRGEPGIVRLLSYDTNTSEERLLALAASVEAFSEHPLGRAIVKHFKGTLLPVTDVHVTPGRGISATLDGQTIAVGNHAYLDVPQTEASSDTCVYVAVNGHLVGALFLADEVRPEAATMVHALQALHLRPLLLTGDRTEVATQVAQQLGIHDVTAECLPETKYETILARQSDGEAVCMIGDGINDAPALRAATVGIAMAKEGCELTVEAADVATLQDSVAGLPHLFALARKTIQTIQRNIILAMGINFIAVTCAMMGWLNPVWGALVHNAGSFVVVALSASLLRWKQKTRR